MPNNLSIFIGMTFLVLVIPGPDFVLVTRNATRGARFGGYLTAAGICASLTIFALLAAVGVADVIARSSAVMLVFRIGGGIYLMTLAVQILIGMRSSRDRQEENGDSHEETLVKVSRLGSPTMQGFFNNILNPKAMVFFLAFLPQFIDKEHPVFGQTLLLGMIVVACAAIWWGCYVTAVGYLGRIMQRPRVRAGIDTCACVALSIFGLLIVIGLS